MEQTVLLTNSKLQRLTSQLNHLNKNASKQSRQNFISVFTRVDEDKEGYETMMRSIEYRVSGLSQQLASILKAADFSKKSKQNNQFNNEEETEDFENILPKIKASIPSDQVGKRRNQSYKEEQIINKEEDNKETYFNKYQSYKNSKNRYKGSVSNVVRMAKQESQNDDSSNINNANQVNSQRLNASLSSLNNMKLARKEFQKKLANQLSLGNPQQFMNIQTSSSQKNNHHFKSNYSFQHYQPTNAILNSLNTSSIHNVNASNVSMMSNLDSSIAYNNSVFANEDSIMQSQSSQLQIKNSSDSTTILQNVKPRLRKGRLYEAKVIPKQIRDNPFAILPKVEEKELQIGLFELLNRRMIPHDADVEPAFSQAGVQVFRTLKKELRPFDEKLLNKTILPSENSILTKFKLSNSIAIQTIQDQQISNRFEEKEQDIFLTAGIADITIESQRQVVKQVSIKDINNEEKPYFEEAEVEIQPEENIIQQNDTFNNSSHLNLENQNSFHLPEMSSLIQQTAESPKQKPLLSKQTIKVIIQNGIIKQDENYESLKRESYEKWGCVKGNLKKIQLLGEKYNISHIEINGEILIEISTDLYKINESTLLSSLLNRQMLSQVIPESSKNCSNLVLKTWAISKLQLFWQIVKAKKVLKAKKTKEEQYREVQRMIAFMLIYFRNKQRFKKENEIKMKEYNKSVEQFKIDWPITKKSHRIEIHLSSFSYNDFQRVTMTQFCERQSSLILRIFSACDEKVKVIYVIPKSILDPMENYLRKLFSLAGKEDSFDRIVFVHPENWEKFPPSISLAKILYYSPKALKKIKTIIGKTVSYLIPSFPSKEDSLIGMKLQVPLFYGNFEAALNINSRGNSRKLLRELELPLTEGEENIFSEQELVNKLALQIIKNRQTTLFYIKLNQEIEGRGLATLNIQSVKYFRKLRLQKECEFSPKRIAKIRNIINDILPLQLHPCMISLFNNYKEFLKRISEEGCVIEAEPTQQVRGSGQLQMLVEPDGTVQVLASFDKIITSSNMTCGVTFPQRQIMNLDAVKICNTIGSKLYELNIQGYFKIDYLVVKDNMFLLMQVNSIIDSITSSFILFNNIVQGKYFPQHHIYQCLDNGLGCEEENHTDSSRFNEKSQQNSFNFQKMASNKQLQQQQKYYSFIPIIFHMGLLSISPKEFFTKSRNSTIFFDVSNITGLLFFIPGEIQQGTLCAFSIGNDKKQSINSLAKGVQFLVQNFGDKVHFNPDQHGNRSDNYFLIDALSSIRSLNKITK